MNLYQTPFKLLTVVLIFHTILIDEAQADVTCQAKLDRVNTEFCLNSSHLQQDSGASAGLSYDWKLSADQFSLSSQVCLDPSEAALGDFVIAIDRSQNIWGADRQRQKDQEDHLTLAQNLLNKAVASAKSQSKKPRVSLILFSSDGDCSQYKGGALTIGQRFPCLYTEQATLGLAEAADSSNGQKISKMFDLLKYAAGLYSQGGDTTTSDYGIVARQVKALGFSSGSRTLIFSDGRSYLGKSGQSWPYLASQNYKDARSEIISTFSNHTDSKLLFASYPLSPPAFGAVHSDALKSMCDPSLNPDPADCEGIDYSKPSTWAVNNLGTEAFIKELVTISQGTYIKLTKEITSTSLVQALQDNTGPNTEQYQEVYFQTDDSGYQTGLVSGTRITIEPIAYDPSVDLKIKLIGENNEYYFPIKVNLQRVEDLTPELMNQEMVCLESGNLDSKEDFKGDENVKPPLDKLQGGSASCGVLGKGSDEKGSTGLLWVLFILPVFLLTMTRRYAAVATCLLVGFIGLAETRAIAQGLNVLQYKPVLDGVGVAERAETRGKYTVGVGIFADYANDALEIGGKKNKRIDSVSDDVVTGHLLFDVGVHDRISLGAHVPYIHKTDLNWTVDGESHEGGKIGRPADSTLHGKFHVRRNKRMEFSLMPILSVPTGEEQYLTGDGTQKYGASLLFSGTTWGSRFVWAANVGYLHRQTPLVLADDRAKTLELKGQYTNYFGGKYHYSKSLAFAASLQMKFNAGDKIDFSQKNPSEWHLLTSVAPTSHLNLEMGMGTGIGKGFGSPDYRVFAGLSYSTGKLSSKAPKARLASAAGKTTKKSQAGKKSPTAAVGKTAKKNPIRKK